MKKYFLALVLLFFAGFSTTHALDLEGVVTDAVSSKNLPGVKVTFSTNPAKSATTQVGGVFTIEDFIPPEWGAVDKGMWKGADISFEKDGYIYKSGRLLIEDGPTYFEDIEDSDSESDLLPPSLIFRSNLELEDDINLGYIKKFPDYEEESYELEGQTMYRPTDKIAGYHYEAVDELSNPISGLKPLEIKLDPSPKKLISGTVYYETEDGDALPLNDASISVSPSQNTLVVCNDFLKLAKKSEENDELSKKFFEWSFAKYLSGQNISCLSTGDDGAFQVWGYFSNEKDKDGNLVEKNYILTFQHPKFGKKDKDFSVINKTKDPIQIVFKERSLSQAREDNLTGITGFKCNELLPKYLVGANCNENKTLEGDASDLAFWIQKIGGKIAGAIAMIAVVLIVWNAFNMVTAAGDEDKISTAKKGLMWAIIGLALTMFAYVIVKTVIMLAYTQ